MPLWTVVVPAKRLDVAKSRLTPLRAALDGSAGTHEELVLAMLADTVAAAVASPLVGPVLVVTDDPAAAAVVVELGAGVVPDEPADGLNPALRHGADTARQRGARAVAALSSDLAALRTAELTAALTLAGDLPRAYLADADGTGTTLLTSVDAPLDPRFGAGSAAAHSGSGAVRLPALWASLARDVDTVADLQHARGLGLGPRTSAWLARAVPARCAGS